MTNESRYGMALILALVGLAIPAALVFALTTKSGWSPDQITSLAGTFIGVIGTLVGSFLGSQAGAAGRQQAEQLTYRALAAMSPDQAKSVLKE